MIYILNLLLCVLILAILGAGAYYASYQWINLRHNRDVITDELKRSMEHISELEERLMQLEANMSLREHTGKTQGKQEATGWDSFNGRG